MVRYDIIRTLEARRLVAAELWLGWGGAKEGDLRVRWGVSAYLHYPLIEILFSDSFLGGAETTVGQGGWDQKNIGDNTGDTGTAQNKPQTCQDPRSDGPTWLSCGKPREPSAREEFELIRIKRALLLKLTLSLAESFHLS